MNLNATGEDQAIDIDIEYSMLPLLVKPKASNPLSIIADPNLLLNE
jgi:hypothetical protein